MKNPPFPPRHSPLSRAVLLEYFLEAAVPREDWQVGMEMEKLGREAATGRAIPYENGEASVRRVLEFIRERRGGDPVLEGDHLIGIDGAWGTISLEPGGQVEWSSRPRASLDDLRRDLDDHLAVLRESGDALGVRWLDAALDPDLPVSDMPWMPKARYGIMKPYLGRRGGLAHRMMTQTASIQCAFDYADPEDWRRKFLAGALLAPLATALFANSSRIDGAESGYRSFRQKIWRDTDPDRCGLPPVVFEPGFGLESWLDYILDVPTMFRHRGRGLVPAGGTPFRDLIRWGGCDAVLPEDWETHISTIFTDVRSYTYIEMRSADLPPDDRIFAVPALWTGILYQDDALTATLELWDDLLEFATWSEAIESAARSGLDGIVAGRSLRELAAETLTIAVEGLRGGGACAGQSGDAARELASLAGVCQLGSRA